MVQSGIRYIESLNDFSMVLTPKFFEYGFFVSAHKIPKTRLYKKSNKKKNKKTIIAIYITKYSIMNTEYVDRLNGYIHYISMINHAMSALLTHNTYPLKRYISFIYTSCLRYLYITHTRLYMIYT